MIIVMSFLKFKSIANRTVQLFLMNMAVFSDVFVMLHLEIVVVAVFTLEVSLTIFRPFKHFMWVVHKIMRLD